MKKLERLIINKNTAIISILLGFLVSIIFTIFGKFINLTGEASPQVFSYYGDFIGGVLGPILSLSGFIIIYLSFNKQNEQHLESNLIIQIDNFRKVETYLITLDNFVSYNEFFKDVYNNLLKGNNSPVGKYELDKTNDGKEIISLFINYKAYVFDYISRINMIIDQINSSISHDKAKYYQLLFSRLSIFEIFFLKTFTTRMRDNKNIHLNGKIINETEIRQRLYDLLVENKLLPETLKKDDKAYYNIYIDTLDLFKIEIPITK